MANIIHSEKGEGFHNFFKEQCNKIAHTHNRCKLESHPIRFSKKYSDNYDDIVWETKKEKNLVKHL